MWRGLIGGFLKFRRGSPGPSPVCGESPGHAPVKTAAPCHAMRPRTAHFTRQCSGTSGGSACHDADMDRRHLDFFHRDMCRTLLGRNSNVCPSSTELVSNHAVERFSGQAERREFAIVAGDGRPSHSSCKFLVVTIVLDEWLARSSGNCLVVRERRVAPERAPVEHQLQQSAGHASVQLSNPYFAQTPYLFVFGWSAFWYRSVVRFGSSQKALRSSAMAL